MKLFKKIKNYKMIRLIKKEFPSIRKKLWKEYINNYPNKNYNEELPHNINEFDAGEYIDKFWELYRYKLSFESTYKHVPSTSQ